MIDVANFVLKSGEPRLTHIKKLKKRSATGYDPKTDFYKRFREGVCAYHRSPVGPKSELDKIALGLTDPKKSKPYQKAIQGYKKFLGAKAVVPFSPTKDIWQRGNMDIRVNPELGLELNGIRHLIKLYPNKERLDQKRADLILVMMKDALLELDDDVEVGVVDVQRGKLFSKLTPKMSLLPLVEAEVAAISVLWASI